MSRAYLLFFLLLTAGCAFAQIQHGRNRTTVVRSSLPPAKPIVLGAHDIEAKRWNASQLWEHQPLLRDSMTRSPKLIFYEYNSDLRVFYRLSRTDTVWREIRPELPQYYCSEEYRREIGCKTIRWEQAGEWNPQVTFSTASWNQRKLPVALLTVTLDMGGNSCATNYEAIYLLELLATPRLLLSALTKHIEGCRGHTDSEGNSHEGAYYGWWRQVSLAGTTLRVGKRRSEGDGYSSHLTPLTPGRYQYRDGHLVWVGK